MIGETMEYKFNERRYIVELKEYKKALKAFELASKAGNLDSLFHLHLQNKNLDIESSI